MFSPIQSLGLSSKSKLDISRHVDSGFRHAHLSGIDNSDSTQSFAAMLVVPTPAEDNKGATHALEHMVLCGSQRFPYRDAFFRMERRSMALHLNAVTNEWLSTFHFHTPSEADFNNLLEFLCDGIFNPLLTEQTFLREVVSQKSSDPATFTGVVYNEMSAMMAMHGVALDVAVRSAMFPDQPFGYLSGGVPSAIATLTPEHVRSFYDRHYQPAKAWLISAGDLDIAACHDRLDGMLAALTASTDRPSSAELSGCQRTSVYAETGVVPDSGSSSLQPPPVHIELAGGLDAVVLAWDCGWRADEFAYLEAHLLLDLLNGRPDSLLQRELTAGTVAAAHLNVVDGQSSRTVLRLGFGCKSGESTRLISHEELLTLIRRSRPTQSRLDSALDRLELLYVSGQLRGAGVDPVNRLRRTAEVLCAVADDSQRARWFQQSDQVKALRELYSSPEQCTAMFARLVDDESAMQRITIADLNTRSTQPSTVEKRSVDGQSEPSSEPIEGTSAQDLPIVDLSQLPLFPARAVLKDVELEPGNGIKVAFSDPRIVTAETIRTVCLLRLPANNGASASGLVHRIENEARRGSLNQLVSTQLEVDGWATLSAGLRAPIIGGVRVTLSGLARHKDEHLHALGQVLNLSQNSVDGEDAAVIQAQQMQPLTRQRHLEAMLRSGHVTAVAAALRQQSGYMMLHHGAGPGLLTSLRQPLGQSVTAQVHNVIIDIGAKNRDTFQTQLSQLLDSISPFAATETALQSGAVAESAQSPADPIRRSLIRVPGSLNYLARAFVSTQTQIDIQTLAINHVLAALARNVYLMDTIRGVGGAYGTGVELVSDTLAIWSYRDPRLEASFSDFDVTMEGLAKRSPAVDQLHEAKLTALTQLNRRYTVVNRPPTSLSLLVNEYECGRTMPELYAAVADVDAVSVMQRAEQLRTQVSIDVALVGKNWRGERSNEFDDFDFRDRSLI